MLYRNHLKNREYAKEAHRFLSNVSDTETAKLKKFSDANETKSGACPTQRQTDSSGCFGISMRWPLLWRYLGVRYCKWFLVWLTLFSCLLLVARFQEIARFAVLNETFSSVLRFIALQWPLLLPITMPLALFAASVSLGYELRHSHELTAMRTHGYPLSASLAPIWFFVALLTFLHLFISAELTPQAHFANKEMLKKEIASDPLLLLQRQSLLALRHSYLTLEPIEKGIQNLTCITRTGDDFSFFHIGQLTPQGDHILAQRFSWIRPSGALYQGAEVAIETPAMLQILKRQPPIKNAQDIPFFALFSKKSRASAYGEIARRLFLSLALLSFALLGFTYTLCAHRHLLVPSVLAITLLICPLFLGKLWKFNFVIGIVATLLPHLLVYQFSYRRLKTL